MASQEDAFSHLPIRAFALGLSSSTLSFFSSCSNSCALLFAFSPLFVPSLPW
jgi:hypothetical protein